MNRILHYLSFGALAILLFPNKNTPRNRCPPDAYKHMGSMWKICLIYKFLLVYCPCGYFNILEVCSGLLKKIQSVVIFFKSLLNKIFTLDFVTCPVTTNMGRAKPRRKENWISWSRGFIWTYSFVQFRRWWKARRERRKLMLEGKSRASVKVENYRI